ncbi:hypothetical protein ACFYTG_56115, partial [Streptomyces mirabilis]|uniref:hypothetical protein n=1 Tax=Streptomyces mirabilis TaxID=68239 RepID=UPI00369E23FD
MLVEEGEHVGDRCAYFLVRVDDDVSVAVVEQADGQRQTQVTALGGGFAGAVQASGQDVQFGLLCGPCRY